MIIAIAGFGDLTRYVLEEFPIAGHQVVILTRSLKPLLHHPAVCQRVTDYSDESLDEALADCEALISTIVDLSQSYVDVHLKLLSACQRSKQCKKFIPSEFTGNARDFPDQPAYFRHFNATVREALRRQNEVQWTIVCVGFFADYIVPAQNRYIRDMREGSLINYNVKEILVPNSLTDTIDMTSARDVIRGLAALVRAPEWDQFTFMSGEKTSWENIAKLIHRRHPDFVARVKTLNQIIDLLAPGNSDDDILFAQLLLYSASGAATCPEQAVSQQRKKLFGTVTFRSLEDLLSAVEQDPQIIV
ncbi:hypothetical protein V2G26_019840 [Clonostachys chloroleuca]